MDKIPEQKHVSWAIAFAISWAGLKRRLLRSLITMLGVVLAIAFLTYMLSIERITAALIAVGDNDLNVALQKAGVNILSAGKTDSMTVILLGLSLLTCAVGIVNAMLMSVTERVREIGTLKCLGAHDMFIVQTYFIESALQGICGALAGMALGCVVAIVVCMKSYGTYVLAYFPYVPVGKALVVSLVCGALISVLAALAPAYAAAKKEPVEALRVSE